MSFNTYGHLYRTTTWGESHGPAIGCIIDGCPPNIPVESSDIQKWLDKRKPGQSRFTTQRQEKDIVESLKDETTYKVSLVESENKPPVELDELDKI